LDFPFTKQNTDRAHYLDKNNTKNVV